MNIILLYFHSVIFVHMVPQTDSTPEGSLALIARKNDSLQMVRFNVVLYVMDHALLSTHFANVSFLLSIGIIVLTFLH